jgi:O-succinylbenzoic acid--CoA ligase
VGGSALSRELRAQAEAVGIRVVETYGSTETCGGCVYDGTPLDGVEIDCTDKAISIRGATLAHSYLNRDLELTHDGWYRTSDLGHIENGKLIIEGRADDVVLSGGVNVSVDAVARTLSEKYPEIESAVCAIEDDKWGHILCAFFVAESGSIDEVEVQSHLDGETFIKKFIYLTELPLQGIGKINRVELHRMAKER